MADADKEIPYRITYDEAIRALSQQQSMVDSIRTRAGLLLSAAAVTTSFLGAQALNAGAPTAATWLALVSFVGLAIATLAILVPHAGLPHELEFTASPEDMIRSYIETDEPSSVAEIYRDLSIHMQRSYDENRADQRKLASRFRFAGVLLTAEVTFWIIDLASKA